MKQLEETLKNRGDSYGNFADLAKMAQKLEGILVVSHMSDVQKEVMGMIATKLARLVCGDANHHDSWIDIAGYSTLAASDLSKTMPGKEQFLGHDNAVARR